MKLSELAKYDNSILCSFIAAAEMRDPKISALSKKIIEKLSKDPEIKEKIDAYQKPKEPDVTIGFTM